jgi:thioredoxin reductase
MTQNRSENEYDVVVVGGGAAGLGAAVTLGRSRRTVAVVDGGQPRNAPAAGVHGYLTRDGIPPAELVRIGRLEAQGYGAELVDGHVEQVTRADDGRLAVRLAGGRTLTGRRLLVATGLVDELPAIPGLRERWGRDVLHCPYCHGWEVRDQQIAVVASGPMSVHQALLFRQLTEDVTYFSHAQPPTQEQEEQLLARGIQIVATEVAAIEVRDDQLTGVRLTDGTTVPCRAVAVATCMRARAGFLEAVGLAPVEHPLGVGEHLPADPQGRTAAAGVWAAGNVTDPSAQVGAASAAGAFAAAQINADLGAEDTRRAVETRRAQRATAAP